jgi:hypothetical protein
MVEPSKGNTLGTLHPKGASTQRRRIAVPASRKVLLLAGGAGTLSGGRPARIYLMRSRMREIRTSGSVRGEGGNPLAYSTGRVCEIPVFHYSIVPTFQSPGPIRIRLPNAMDRVWGRRLAVPGRVWYDGGLGVSDGWVVVGVWL